MNKEPVILIVGRPNVGKSTLFNSLTASGHAIVYDTPGSTRDINLGTIHLGSKHYKILDTGGICEKADYGSLQEHINQQVKLLLLGEQSTDLNYYPCVVLLVVEEATTSDDLMIRESLRLCCPKSKVVLLINKCKCAQDYDAVEQLQPDAYFFIDAKTHTNLRSVRAYLRENLEQQSLEQSPKIIKVGIIGKPNVGKSSLFNAICKTTRVTVRDEIGTTVDPISVMIQCTHKDEIQQVELWDTGGLLRSSKLEKGSLFYLTYQAALQIAQTCDVICYTMDETITRNDQKLIRNLYNTVQKPILLLYNKIELNYKPTSYLDFKYLNISVHNDYQVNEILPLCIDLFNDYNKPLVQETLETIVQDLLNKHNPDQVKVKVKIDTDNCLSIYLQNKNGVNRNYIKYLGKGIKTKLNINALPLRIGATIKDKSEITWIVI